MRVGIRKKLDKHATRKCKCSEAREWVEFENSKERTEKKIKELFESDCTITEILISNIESVAKRDIAKITIDSGAGYKGSLSVTPKGSLKVEKNISKKITWEVE